MLVVGRWTGREAQALRYALRMTFDEFAEHLGVARRTVAKWMAEGADIVPLLVLQEALDTALDRASDQAKRRFTSLLVTTAWRCQTRGNATGKETTWTAGKPSPRDSARWSRLTCWSGSCTQAAARST